MKQIKYILIALLIGIIYFIFGNIYNIYIPCVFHELTGLYCPGCGTTRMINSLIRLDFYQAFRYNQMVFILIPIFTLYLIDFIYKSIKNKKPLLYKTPNYIWYIIVVLLVIFGIIRNIFPYFAPTVI